MKRSIKLLISTLLLIFITSIAFSQQKQPNWKAPEKYKTMKGKGDPTNGKELFVKHCKSCHGSKGLGDGPKSMYLKTFPGDFTNKKFQTYTDGEIYFISFIGMGDMPNFEKKIIDNSDRWSIVSYIKNLK